MAGKSGERLLYADLLRVCATVAVIMIHISGGWISETAVGSAAWNTLNLYDGLAHWSVPAFIMLSGMFLLDLKREVTLHSLLFRQTLRLVAALVVWSAVYALFGAFLETGTVTLADLVGGLKELVWGKLHYHLWFLPMMIGLYLVTPILRGFVRGATGKELGWYFLLAFVLAMVLPTTLALRPSKTVSSWLSQLDIRIVLSYASYYVLGYCLKTCTLSLPAELTIYGLGAAGAVWTVWGTAWLSQMQGARFTFYNYNSPNIALMSAAVFLLFRRLPLRGSGRWISALSAITFGIYLCHDLFIMLLRHFGVSTLSFLPALSVPLLTLGVFLCAALVAWPLSKIPLVGRLIT